MTPSRYYYHAELISVLWITHAIWHQHKSVSLQVTPTELMYANKDRAGKFVIWKKSFIFVCWKKRLL